MNSQFRRETAKILQFPPPGARARNAQGAKANGKQNAMNLEMVTCVGGGAWYHEAAIVEAERPRKA